MSHEMMRKEAEEEYGVDAVDNLDVTQNGFLREQDIIDVWPLLPNAEDVPTTQPEPELVGASSEMEPVEWSDNWSEQTQQGQVGDYHG